MCWWVVFWFYVGGSLLPSSSIQIIRASCTVKMGLYLRIFFSRSRFVCFFSFFGFGGRFFFGTANTSPSLPTSLTSSLPHTPHHNKFVHFNRFAVFFCIFGFFFKLVPLFQKIFISWRPSIQSILGSVQSLFKSPPAAFPFVSFRTSSHRSRNLARSLYLYIDVSVTPSPHLPPRPFYF